MRILWDFRLFSFGYRDRGVGVYVRAMASAICGAKGSEEIFIWANKADLPDDMAALPVQLIPYRKGSWKADLVRIPVIIKMCGASVFHYWVAMGPITGIGMGMSHPGRTCMTVHDLGVEFVTGDPFLAHVRDTWYWKTQKQLIRQADIIVCNSEKTKAEVSLFLEKKCGTTAVLYPPVSQSPSPAAHRSKVFFALAGAPHKNLSGVIRAFSVFKKTHESYSLVVLGSHEPGEIPAEFETLVTVEPMDKYRQYCDTAAGLVFCSTYEGLGMPPLEAMASGCPVVASDLPSLRETCEGAARFVDPLNADAIAQGMADVADNRELWIKNSVEGFTRYSAMSAEAGKKWIELYKSLG